MTRKNRSVSILLLAFTLVHSSLAQETLPPLKEGVAPQIFEALWAGYDPRAEPLEIETLKAWEEDGVVLRVVRYRIGIFKGQKAMMAAVYGYPKGGTQLPGLVQIHGGGQYADYRAVLTNAKRGYATISIAWAGRISAPGYQVSPDIVKLFWEGNTSDPEYKLTTDWGAHMFDIAQWGLGMDNSGPVEITPPGYKDFKFLTYKYKNGVIMTEEPFNSDKTKGVKFQGKDGWIEVSRGHFKASDPSYESKIKQESGPYETKIPHQVNFIEAVRKRKDPVVPVEIGHRSCTVCTLGNISYDLGRSIKWDPKTEEFVDDLQAELYMHREYRKGYTLPAL